MSKIYFHDSISKSTLVDRKNFKKFLLDIFKKEKKLLYRLDIVFCTDEFLIGLNKDFLNHDYYTDTLTFLLSLPKDPILGESYISIDRIKENAKKFKVVYYIELLRVIIHSCLHLCGYLDKIPQQRRIMLEKQEMYLQEWIVSRETLIGS